MKKSISLLLAVVMLLSCLAAAPLTANAVEASGSAKNFTWRLSGTTLTISPKGDCVMDDSYGFFSYADSITDVVFESGMKETGVFAYYKSIESVSIPAGCKITHNAFEATPLTSVTIAEGVEEIGEWAFASCKQLQNINIPGSVKSIGEKAFNYCEKLQELTLNEGLESIGTYAFCGARFYNVFVPHSVQSIAEKAFGFYYENYQPQKKAGFSLDGYADSVAKSYAAANGFSYYEHEYEPYPYFDAGDGKIRLIFEESTSALTAAYDGTEPLTVYDQYVADYKTKAKSITLSGKIGSIAPQAFMGFSQLESLTLPDGLKEINAEAFFACPKLKTVTVPYSVTYIGYVALGYVYNSKKGGNTVISGFTLANKNCKQKEVRNYIRDYGKDAYGGKMLWSTKHTYDKGAVSGHTANTYTKTFTCSTCHTSYDKVYKRTVSPMSAKGKTSAVKYSLLKKKAQSVTVKNAYTIQNAKGTLGFKKTAGSAKITVAKNGKITLAKGLKKGSYTISVKITDSGTGMYKTVTKTVKIIIKIK